MWPDLGVTVTKRAGRKRKAGARYKSGALRHKPTKELLDERTRTARRMPHRRALRSSLREDERAESPIGRLNLTGKIGDEQYSAAQLFAVAVGEYRSTIEAPRGTAGSGRGRGCEGCDLVQRAGCRCLERKRRYDAAFEALAMAGQRAAKAVSRLVVHREELAREDLVYLVDGLSALAGHYGLTGRRRARQSRNTH